MPVRYCQFTRWSRRLAKLDINYLDRDSAGVFDRATCYNIVMIKIILIVFAALLGAAFGSFACCQAWRIRLMATKKKDLGKRSVCLHCGKQLAWYENVPIVSWLIQGGKCRKCGKKIGYAEILAELFGLLSFGAITWRFMYADAVTEPISWEALALLIILFVMIGLMILAVYDGKWQEMPTSVLAYTVIMSAVFVLVTVLSQGFSISNLLPYVWSAGLLAGVYYLLYFFSKEKLVGGGDWILCVAIGLLLGSWQLALVELFLANFLGAIVMLSRREKKTGLGPFLIIAFVIIFVAKDWLLGFLAIG